MVLVRKGLNPDQLKAVRFGTRKGVANQKRPLLILAGAGTGKTRTLVHRVAHLIECGVPRDQILLLTFTNKAAAEMCSRTAHLLSGPKKFDKDALPFAGTFHAVASKLLRRFAKQVGLQPNFTIWNRSDSCELMQMERARLKLTKRENSFPTAAECLEIYSYSVNSCLSLAAVLKMRHPELVRHTKKLEKLSALYIASKRRMNVLDFDDLLTGLLHLVRDKSLGRKLRQQFKFIMVDEYQDLNPLQIAILRDFSRKGAGVTVVGDDAQAIYSFRGSASGSLREFVTLYPRKSRIIKLEQNYRSTKPILAAANKVMARSKETIPKELWSKRGSDTRPELVAAADDLQQSQYVADQIAANKEAGIPFANQAVLMRVAAHGRSLEVELMQRGIPFEVWGGLKLVETAHVRDVLCVLRWAENAQDHVAGMRALLQIPQVGQKTALSLLDGGGLPQLAKRSKQLGKVATRFVTLMDKLHKKKWRGQCSAVVKWYLPLMSAKFDNADSRAADLQQLAIIADGFVGRSDFLLNLSLESPGKLAIQSVNESSDEDRVTLSTIHSAKGHEWSEVFILNALDGCIPSSRSSTTAALEEERRLLYVAMTRAKNSLKIVQPRRLFSSRPGGRVHDLFSQPTPFIRKNDRRAFDSVAAMPKRQGRLTRASDAVLRPQKAETE